MLILGPSDLVLIVIPPQYTRASSVVGSPDWVDTRILSMEQFSDWKYKQIFKKTTFRTLFNIKSLKV